MSRNKCFFSRFEYHMFYVLYPFVTCLLTLPYTCVLRPAVEISVRTNTFVGARTAQSAQ
jgi:hypothetical protein